MKDLGWVAAMGKPGGGRNDVDPRFISLFTVFNMTFPAEESLFLIYNSILAGHTANFSDEIKAIVPDITKMTMELYKWVINKYNLVDCKNKTWIFINMAMYLAYIHIVDHTFFFLNETLIE